MSVLSGSTSVSGRVRIWIVVDRAFAGRVNDPVGAITSFDVAVPPRDTVNEMGVALVALALTTNPAGDGLFTTLDVGTIVSVGTAVGVTSVNGRAAAGLMIGGGPIVKPADVSVPSLYPVPCWSATFTVCVVAGVAAG